MKGQCPRPLDEGDAKALSQEARIVGRQGKYANTRERLFAVSGQLQAFGGCCVVVEHFPAVCGGQAGFVKRLKDDDFIVGQYVQAIAAKEPQQRAWEGWCELWLVGEQAHHQRGPVGIELSVFDVAEFQGELAQGVFGIHLCGACIQGAGEFAPQRTAVLQILRVIHRLVRRVDCGYNSALQFSRGFTKAI